jgi:hypothetical protein
MKEVVKNLSMKGRVGEGRVVFKGGCLGSARKDSMTHLNDNNAMEKGDTLLGKVTKI